MIFSLWISREIAYGIDGGDIRLECWSKAKWNEARGLVQDRRCYAVVDAKADSQGPFTGEEFYGKTS